MFQIDRFEFNDCAAEEIEKVTHWGVNVGKDWPVVYIINNDKEAYVGETFHAKNRVEQHLANPERRSLTEIRIMSDKDFNKSVALDLEAFLIKHMSADKKYVLQNRNDGLHDHKYYNKSEYEEGFKELWKKLRKEGVVQKSINEIENSELYKYSPYKSLGPEQLSVEARILSIISEYADNDKGATIVVSGGAGTGKTILGIYLMKIFADAPENGSLQDIDEDFYLDDPIPLSVLQSHLPNYKKIGIVVPQKSLQASLQDVFKSISNLSPKMVLSPADVVKDYVKTHVKYDLLIVDEAHRLKCRDKGHLSNYRIFDDCNKALGLDVMTGSELDWLLECSRNQVFFRDELQTVRPCDIDQNRFEYTISEKYRKPVFKDSLSTQWRCLGGNDYIDYIRQIISCHDSEKKDIENYDLRLYLSCDQMIEAIKAKNEEMGLCRVVAGYAWPWDRKRTELKTIRIQGKDYRWNTTYQNWVSTNAVDEIGCIHTVQGYDLNYCGVIIGEDIKYDPDKKQIYADKSNYYDQQGKSGVANDPEGLKQYLCNIYLTLLTRGIRGTYVYVCNNELREYMKQYFPVY